MTDQRQLPPALAARVRDYFGALLSARDVDDAMHELASDVAFWGDDRPVDVLAAARTIVHSRIRVADDLEALVLREDLGLTVDETAQVMKRGPEEVRHLLEAAAVELQGDLAPSPGTSPVATEAAAPEQIPRATIPAPRDGGEIDDPAAPEIDDPVAPEDADEPTASSRATGTDDARRMPDRPAPPDGTGPATAAPRGAPDEPGSGAPPDTRRRTVTLLAIVAVAVTILAIVLRPSGEPACPAGAEVCVVESVMTDAVDATGEPAASRDTFTTAEDARIWFRYRRDGDVTDPQVEVVWYRGEQRLYESAFRLPTADRANVALAKLFMTEPGDYRVELLSSGEVIAEERFRVVAADG